MWPHVWSCWLPYFMPWGSPKGSEDYNLQELTHSVKICLLLTPCRVCQLTQSKTDKTAFWDLWETMILILSETTFHLRVFQIFSKKEKRVSTDSSCNISSQVIGKSTSCVWHWKVEKRKIKDVRIRREYWVRGRIICSVPKWLQLLNQTIGCNMAKLVWKPPLTTTCTVEFDCREELCGVIE